MPEETTLPVAAARAGNQDAWNALFQRYQLPLFTYIVDLLHDEPASFDVVQETFLRAFRHLAGLRDDRRFGSWLFGIAHQLVVQSWRRRGRSPFTDALPEDEDLAPAKTLAPDLERVRAEQHEDLLAAIDALPEAQRGVLLLHYLEDFSLAEIAEITGVPAGTVKSRLHHARLALRDRLATDPRQP